jgi:hypothetical protein
MSWERHELPQYYYRVQRHHQGRPPKTSYRSAVAQRAADADHHQRALRQQAPFATHPVSHLASPLTSFTHGEPCHDNLRIHAAKGSGKCLKSTS